MAPTRPKRQAVRRASRAPFPRVTAVELGDWPVLGKDSRIEVSARFTVLVGRNGVGKSAIFDGIESSASVAVGGAHPHTLGPPRFRCEIEIGRRAVAYECRWKVKSTPAGAEASSETRPTWSERCWDLGTHAELWTTGAGTAKVTGAPDLALPEGFGLLALGENTPDGDGVVPSLRRLFRSIKRVRAGVPRPGERQIVWSSREPGKGWGVRVTNDRIEQIGVPLLNWQERDPVRFREFTEVGKRMGIWQAITVETFVIPAAGKGSEKTELGMVLVDGVSLGLLSDGTLRIAELLRYLLSPVPRLLLVEEPETSLHPGMLQRLLAELQAYRGDNQTLMSTHSPQVVGGAQPEELRLVTRSAGRTDVRSLTPAQSARLGEYLCDEGHLGDFVFGGAADD